MKISSIGVFMGSQSGNDPQYIEAAEELGKRIALKKIKLVFGAGKDGLMGATARSAMEAGGSVLGISPRNLAEEAFEASEITQLIEVNTMTDRKQLLMDNSDVLLCYQVVWNLRGDSTSYQWSNSFTINRWHFLS